MIASCAVDVKFHDWENGDCLGAVSPPDPKSKGFLDISWCNEGKHLAAVPITGKSLVITPAYATTIPPIPGREEVWKPVKELIDVSGVRCASFSKVENGHLVLGTVTGEVMLYNANTKKVSQNFMDLPSPVNMIECGAQDSFIAAGCGNGQIFIYGAGNMVSSSYFVTGSETLSKIAVHGKIPFLLAGGSEKGVIAMWDICSGSNILRSANHSGSVMDMAFSTTDDSFTTIGSDQKINIYDLRTSECVHEKQFDTSLTALAYCPNGTDLAVATGRGQIICLDKRYLHSCKSGLKAHQCPIKKITFESCNCSKSEYEKSSEGIDYLEEELPSMDAELKTPGSGDFSLIKSKVRFSGNIYQNLDKSSVGTSRCQMANMNTPDRTTFHIIDENSLNQLREEITKTTKDIVNDLVETMNSEFLKMRMGVSREFCTIEIQNKKRWHDFNTILLKISDMDEHVDDKSVSEKAHSAMSQIDDHISKTQFPGSVLSKEYLRL